MFWPKTNKSGIKCCVIKVHLVVLVVYHLIVDFIVMDLGIVLVDCRIRPHTVVPVLSHGQRECLSVKECFEDSTIWQCTSVLDQGEYDDLLTQSATR